MVHCAFRGCNSGSYNLEQWKKNLCEIHKVKHMDEGCSCPQPYFMHPFPTKLKNPELRKIWISIINRKKTQTKVWTPEKFSRLCSLHFKDEMPTEENPYPNHNLPEGAKYIKSRKPPAKKGCVPKRKRR